MIVQVHNPLTGEPEVIETLPEGVTGAQAELAAVGSLRARGLRHGELLESGARAGKVVYGFKERSTLADSQGYIGFINNTEFFWFMRQLRDHLDFKMSSFADLGCGPGNILLSVRHLYGDATKLIGVELDPLLCSQARTVLPDAEIVEADLMEWQPSRVPDVVYLYDPAVFEPAREKFMQHLRSWLPAGQRVIFASGAPVSTGAPAWLLPVSVPGCEKLRDTGLFTVAPIEAAAAEESAKG